MTQDGEHWRDARLKKALDSAPDADARPSNAVREAILNKARLTAAAAASPAPAPAQPQRWRWWQGLATAGALVFVVLIGGRQYFEPSMPLPTTSQPASEPAAPVAAQAPSTMTLAIAEQEQAAQHQREALSDARAQRQKLEQAKQRVAHAPQAAEAAKPLPLEPPVTVAAAPAAPPPAAMPMPIPMPAPAPTQAPAPAVVADAVPAAWTSLRIGGAELQREQLSASAVAVLDRLLAGEPQAMRLSEKRAALRSDRAASFVAAPSLQIELLRPGQPPRPLAIPAQETQLRLELQRAGAAAASAP